MTGTYAIVGHPIAIAPDLWIQPTLYSPLPASSGQITTISAASLSGATTELNALIAIGNATQIGQGMYSRPFNALPTLSVMFIASGATSQVAASNAARSELRLQAPDAFWLGVSSGVPSAAGGMPALFQPSGVQAAVTHPGAVYAFSGAANGATLAIRIWETSIG